MAARTAEPFFRKSRRLLLRLGFSMVFSNSVCPARQMLR